MPTFLDHCTTGGGLPLALHSNDTDPPFLAVVCPFGGRICKLGGTVTEKLSHNVWLVFQIFRTGKIRVAVFVVVYKVLNC